LRYFFAILFVFLCLANMAKAEICNDLIEVNSIYDKVFLKSASVKDVRTLQKYVGAAQDGKWGPKSDAAYAQLLDRCDSVNTPDKITFGHRTATTKCRKPIRHRIMRVSEICRLRVYIL
jgi:hypothetical protein